MRKTNINFNINPNKWKLSKKEFGQFKKKYHHEERYQSFLDYLNDLYVYYLNDSGLSINSNNSEVTPETATYMWSQMQISFNNEPLYVWMHQKGGGEYNKIAFGTKREFDRMIISRLTN